MIDFFFGKPRSGKSYRAMKLINDLYLDNNDEPKHRNILTNIAGFKFDVVNRMLSDKGSTSLSYKLSWKSFYKHLKKMYEMAIDEKSDEELIRYADYHLINDCFIILDEAALYMKKYDDVISWWLSYHGHFKIRVLIIAQGPKQINPEYMTHTEIYYEAQPQSKQLRNDQLRYLHYDEPPTPSSKSFSSNTITTKQEIYNLYKSGETDKPKKIIYKFIAISLVAVFALFFFINLLLTNMKERGGVTDESQTTEQITNVSTDPFNNSDLEFLNLRCDNRFCWNVDTNFERKSITMSYFKFIVLKYDLELQYSEIKNEIYKLIPQKRGQSKITLAYLEDYYYMYPSHLKTTLLKDLFIPRVKERERLTAPSPFENTTGNKESETQKQATSA